MTDIFNIFSIKCNRKADSIILAYPILNLENELFDDNFEEDLLNILILGFFCHLFLTVRLKDTL